MTTVTRTTETQLNGAASQLGPQPVTSRECAIDQVERVTDDVIVLTLSAPDGSDLPAWEPGAHIDLVLDSSTVRQYSLCGHPEDRSKWQVAIRRIADGRGGSIRLHEHATAGSTIAVGGPRNAFRLVDGSAQYLFVAGGIGITPLLPMIAALTRADAQWRMVYGGRTRESMPFVQTLSQYGDRVMIVPEDEMGLLDLPAVFADLTPGTAVYCCGPEPLISAVEECCTGQDAVELHVERFAPKTDGSADPKQAFEVYCAKSDLTLTVPADKSLLQVVEEAGIEILSACREGTCGTCEVDVLEGTPEHRDSLLTAQEREANESMMICVSRCAGKKLTIDL